MVIIECLKKARRLIKAGFCKRTSARDSRGRPVQPLSDKAVRFCSDGACARVALPWNYIKCCTELDTTILKNGYRRGIITYNDTHYKVDVLKVFDKTIRRLSRTK